MQGKTTLINSNGGWCWYQDERVIVDRDTGQVLVATIAVLAGRTETGAMPMSMSPPSIRQRVKRRL
ncbi:MAG: hypothetical protein ACFE0O_02410 [Opitutales bacterium]